MSLKEFVIAMHALALSSTVVRVIDRCWARRMWWDDYLATLLLVIDPLVIAIYSTVFAHGFSEDNFVDGYFAVVALTNSTMWIARITLLLGITRVFPPWTRTRRIALGITALCFVFLIAGLALNILLCKLPGQPVRKITWQGCKTTGSMGGMGVPLNFVIETAFHAFSDILLVIFPFTIFWRVKLPRHQRRLILTAGSGSILVLIPVSMHLIFVFAWGGLSGRTIVNGTFAQTYVTTSIFVANMLVVVTFAYRMRHKLSRRLRQSRCANQPRESSTRPESNARAADSLRDGENDEHRYRNTARTARSTPITTLTLTEVLTDPSIRHDDFQCVDDEYLEVDSQWAGPGPRASVTM